MNFSRTKLEGAIIIEPKIFGDTRGYFFESYNREKYLNIGINDNFIQDNESMSSFGVLRGLHYQIGEYAQSKLVRVVEGKVLDVAVDLRKSSKTFGQYEVVELSDENKRQFYIPRGFAHGFVVLSEKVIFTYKCDNIYSPTYERGIIYNDISLNINWQVDPAVIKLSKKDLQLPKFKDAEYFN